MLQVGAGAGVGAMVVVFSLSLGTALLSHTCLSATTVMRSPEPLQHRTRHR